ncbi:MAG: DUF502 domain-containing protein [Gammaproteobacteria bacterium]
MKILIAAFQTKPKGVERIVLIDFPSPGMKAIGFVTRTLIDEASGEELAVVYVPISPNPTSGYIEIVAVTKVISTDWTLDEAMQFLMSAGTAAPDTIALQGMLRPETNLRQHRNNHKGRLATHRHTTVI